MITTNQMKKLSAYNPVQTISVAFEVLEIKKTSLFHWTWAANW